MDPSISASFRPISNLNNISKILERFFLYVCNHILLCHLIVIICKQPIANITALKPFSFISLIISIMQLIMGLPPYFSLLTLVLPLIPLIMLSFSIVSLASCFCIMGSSHNWLKSYISGTGHFQSLLAYFLCNIIVTLWCSPRLCLGSYSFHNLCLTNCSNYIFSRCQSAAIC